MRAIAGLMMMPLAALAVSAAAAAPPSAKAGIEAWQNGDYAQAVAIWRVLAEDGNADASFNLGQAYRLGRGVPINLAAAQTWLTRAAKKDHLDAQATLGLLLFDSGDIKGAMPWLKVAAERGEARAQLVYGTALYNGDGGKRDPLLGYMYVSKSAAKGLKAAKTALAELDAILPADQRKKAAAITPQPARERVAAAARAEPKASPAPAATGPSAGGWRIQLGAFSKRSSAEALFKRLSPSLAGKQAVFSAAGAVTRLQVGPYSKAEAQSACASLSKQGQACFPVQAK